MKLWKIYQNHNKGYDTYDSAVVAAETESEAQNTHPGTYPSDYDWAPHDYVFVELIGEAIEGTRAGVIVSSFNAG